METTRTVIPADPLAEAASHASAVSWGAILAGAAAACAISLIFVFLGLGLGMSAISPWSGSGASAATLSVGAILWITLAQVVAALIGGYLAGRLRVRWAYAQRDEVYFRDTAHGFVAWAVATLLVALCFTTTMGNVMKAGAAFSGAAMQGAGAAMAGNLPGPRPHESREGMDYAIDVLMRRSAPTASIDTTAPEDAPTAEPPAPDAPMRGRDGNRGEVMRIYERAMQSGTLADADAKYLASMIAQRSGISEAEAQTRVKQAFTDLQAAAQAAKETADKARKAAAYTSLWLFIALLAGAFFACLAATFGGRQRDYEPVVRR